jgi:uncharacterized protein
MIDVPDQLRLTDAEARVLGALMEKRRTTPDVYPMTLKAVTTACNQSTSRDPVVAYDQGMVDDTLGTLKAKGLVRMVHPGAGERSTKFRHVADEALGLDDAATAVLCVLLLRGPQTAAELKARTERLHQFADTEATETVLHELAGHQRQLVTQLDRLPGRKERRWQQLLTTDAPPSDVNGAQAPDDDTPDDDTPDDDTGNHGTAPGETTADLATRVAVLEQRVDQLMAVLGDLMEVTDPGVPPSTGGDGRSPDASA